MPAIQVVLRSQLTRAAKGNGPAQRTAFETVQAIESGCAAQAALKDKAEADKPPMSDLEAARRIAFLLSNASLESGKPQPSQPVKRADRKKKEDS
jgi:hypothetical protein